MDKICSVQLCLGLLTVFSIMLLIPSAHGKPLALQGKLKLSLDDIENPGFPERGDTNHQDGLLTLLLNKNLGWRQPAASDLELAKKFEELEQLEKLKEQLLAGEGSEEAYAEAGLLPSHPDKRGPPGASPSPSPPECGRGMPRRHHSLQLLFIVVSGVPFPF
ncbi:urotensin-2B [Terrapene carolina triunguis]|uniref:urotensin-2B n=1 Tax=Terrapene triunguis TaxID=2587831 RepID=UPI000E775A02|nr:urotensin-2B [Terrapene carolina triunguis]